MWLGREDSNLRITGPKPAALPLGYAPRAANEGGKSIVEQALKVKHPENRAADPLSGAGRLKNMGFHPAGTASFCQIPGRNSGAWRICSLLKDMRRRLFSRSTSSITFIERTDLWPNIQRPVPTTT